MPTRPLWKPRGAWQRKGTGWETNFPKKNSRMHQRSSSDECLQKSMGPGATATFKFTRSPSCKRFESRRCYGKKTLWVQVFLWTSTHVSSDRCQLWSQACHLLCVGSASGEMFNLQVNLRSHIMRVHAQWTRNSFSTCTYEDVHAPNPSCSIQCHSCSLSEIANGGWCCAERC